MYKKFRQINGQHPWRDVSTEGFVDYPARIRKGGRVLYFNYDLAAEMGLLPRSHAHQMNPELEEHILDAFSLQIVNEYDMQHGLEQDPQELKAYPFMATRYLQLQHKNKQGKTSGDGRSIWNGVLHHRGRTFDISSRGTGATILSPGAQEAKGPIATGSDEVGYASGLADVEEMLGSAIMSEIFYREGIPSERCLAVIDYADGSAIGVRTAPNLLRPAHIFRYLKMGQHRELKRSLQYFLNRQEANGSWVLPPSGKRRYMKALKYFAATFARLAAVMEEEYIFNWLAWDGDNLLATGAILDYGSIRQFAAKHNKYRYEDVDGYSTCLMEQRHWAKATVQVFAQVVDFVLNKEKRPLKDFANDPHLKLFDRKFEQESLSRMLWRVGFDRKQIDYLLKHAPGKVKKFRKSLNYFEDVKTVEGQTEVADGIDHPPVFLVRNILRKLPKFYLALPQGQDEQLMPAAEFCLIMAVTFAAPEDLQLTPGRKRKAKSFQEHYKQLVRSLPGDQWKNLNTVSLRSDVINHPHRRTGDGLVWIVNEAVSFRDRIDRDQFQEAIEAFIQSQVLIPGQWQPVPEEELKGNRLKARLLRSIQENLEIYKETI